MVSGRCRVSFQFVLQPVLHSTNQSGKTAPDQHILCQQVQRPLFNVQITDKTGKLSENFRKCLEVGVESLAGTPFIDPIMKLGSCFVRWHWQLGKWFFELACYIETTFDHQTMFCEIII